MSGSERKDRRNKEMEQMLRHERVVLDDQHRGIDERWRLARLRLRHVLYALCQATVSEIQAMR
jgi:hypothetical protein